MYNALLMRQLKKHLGPDWQDVLPEKFHALLWAVSQTYDHHHTDRMLLERAMDLSSQELTEANNRLREEAGRQQVLIGKLKEFIHELQRYSGVVPPDNTEADDVIAVAEHLADQIRRRQEAELQLQASQARLTALVESTTDLIWSIDTGIKITGCNSAFRRMFASEQGPAPCIGAEATDGFPAGEEQFWQDLYERALNGRAFRQEYSRRTDHGDVCYELSVTPIIGGDTIMGVSIFGRDITEHKQAERELQAALARERELSLLKTRFVGTVSHEFRTPLSGIMMSTELLDRYIDRMNSEERKAEIARIRERVSELTRLMDDVLLQSAAESIVSLYRPDTLDIRTLCATVLDDMASLVRQSNHRIESHIDEDVPVLWADSKLLRYVLRNLLSNAVKYSPAGSCIRFTVFQRYDQVFFQVSDRGIGIPDEELPLLFNPFFRASNTGSIKGTGLGLSIVKEFIDIHGGDITVDSRVGVGTTFTVRLPVQAYEQTVQQTG